MPLVPLCALLLPLVGGRERCLPGAAAGALPADTMAEVAFFSRTREFARTAMPQP
jgi:hypothetical protein